jgi:hypothetical protein
MKDAPQPSVVSDDAVDPDVLSFSRKLIESFVEEDAVVGTTSKAAPAAPNEPAAAHGSGGPILLQYANYLGMDVVADSDLLWIAQQALTAELPPGWTEHADPMSGDNYCATPASKSRTIAVAACASPPLTVLIGRSQRDHRRDCMGAPVRRLLPRPVCPAKKSEAASRGRGSALRSPWCPRPPGE